LHFLSLLRLGLFLSLALAFPVLVVFGISLFIFEKAKLRTAIKQAKIVSFISSFG
jgi:hypothetical protein